MFAKGSNTIRRDAFNQGHEHQDKVVKTTSDINSKEMHETTMRTDVPEWNQVRKAAPGNDGLAILKHAFDHFGRTTPATFGL